MTIETAKFLVQRNGAQFKCTGAELPTKLQDGDLMAVTRPGDDTYKWEVTLPPPILPWTLTTTESNYVYYQSFKVGGAQNSILDVTINWGDGSPEEQATALPYIEHVYSTPGTYSPFCYTKAGIPFRLEGIDDRPQRESMWLIKSYGPPSVGHKLPNSCSKMMVHMRAIEDTSFSFLADFDFSEVTNFNKIFQYCQSMESFPSIDLSSVFNFHYAWNNCIALKDFPANMFDNTPPITEYQDLTSFGRAFYNCLLTPQSIENILVSLDVNGQSNLELGIERGNSPKPTWTPAANAAFDNLIAKGWTITYEYP